MDWPFPDVSLDLCAELDIGGTTDEQEQADARSWREWTTPRTIFPKFSISTINGNVVTRIGEGPNTNRKWEVKRLVMSAANPVGAAAITNTTVYLFRDVGGGRGLVTPGNFESMELLWTWTSLPITQLWGRDELTVFNSEDLILVVNSNGINALSGNIQVLDKPIIDVTPYRVMES